MDFHTHIYPELLARRVIEHITAMDVPCYCEATAPALRRSMKRAGITHSVLCNIATKPGQTASIVNFALEIRAQEQAGHTPCFIPFASVHPYEEGWKDWLHKIKALGFLGIKLHPDYQAFFIDDPRMEPFYREVASLGLIVIFHAGFDTSMPEVTHATTGRIWNVLPLLEECTTVLAHMGGYAMEERTYEFLCGRNVYFDTSFNLMEIDPAFSRKMFLKHGSERFLYGTDSPWRDQTESVAFFRDRFAPGFLSPEAIRGVLWDNGAKLLGLDNQGGFIHGSRERWEQTP